MWWNHVFEGSHGIIFVFYCCLSIQFYYVEYNDVLTTCIRVQSTRDIFFYFVYEWFSISFDCHHTIMYYNGRTWIFEVGQTIVTIMYSNSFGCTCLDTIENYRECLWMKVRLRESKSSNDLNFDSFRIRNVIRPVQSMVHSIRYEGF